MTSYLTLLCLILISVLYWMVRKINIQRNQDREVINFNFRSIEDRIKLLQSQIKQLKVKKEK